MSSDTPTSGLYKTKLIKNGPWVPVRIWFGPPHDPVTGDVMDRSWRWQAEKAGKLCTDINQAWPWCARNEIYQSEYDYLVACCKHNMHPASQPRKKVDLMTVSLRCLSR
jgi:hypothetical protein